MMSGLTSHSSSYVKPQRSNIRGVRLGEKDVRSFNQTQCDFARALGRHVEQEGSLVGVEVVEVCADVVARLARLLRLSQTQSVNPSLDSTRITSAPKSESVRPAIGPAPNQEKSATRMPSSGRVPVVGVIPRPSPGKCDQVFGRNPDLLDPDFLVMFADLWRRTADARRRRRQPVRRSRESQMCVVEPSLVG